MRAPASLFLAGILIAVASATLDSVRAEAPTAVDLSYLDGGDPYYVGLGFPKLTTPMWVGEEGVEAVVVLAIDDMTNNPDKYETYLRPILDRLKAIDGRAPVSIMTCRVDPTHPRVAAWIKEGLNLDVHTLTHPCPLLQKGDFGAAANAVHDCVDLLSKAPGNSPTAFRMPCCDSLNTPSPRFFSEIFNKKSSAGRYLSIDSSVFTILTSNDPSLPRNLVQDADGADRFRKYLPFKSFVNTIEDYPYPYLINKLCWEFPCIVPSDWEAQHLLKPNHPRMLEDMKAALDLVVIKKGVFNLVFHPHGWIKNEQVAELIDHAVRKHGRKVKFLNFREARDRIDKHLLGGTSVRSADGGDNGVRLLDLNDDGFQDVVIANRERRETRLWNPAASRWEVGDFPAPGGGANAPSPGLVEPVRFGRFGTRPTRVGFLSDSEDGPRAFVFDGRGWRESPELRPSLPTARGVGARDRGLRFRDLDHDGISELILSNPAENLILKADSAGGWTSAGYSLPPEAILVDREGRDRGVRFVDIDEDRLDDIVYSNDESFGVDLMATDASTGRNARGWTKRVLSGKAGASNALPRIVREGTNDGFWVHSRHLWWQNENTAKLPDLVDRRSFNDLLKEVAPGPRSPRASRDSIRTRPGFRVELVASEPAVMDPVAFDWGVDGKFWVAEPADYPLGIDGKGKKGGRVRFLEDRDGDGSYETSTLFLEGLGYPNGVTPWGKGVLISLAPDILYAEDTNGDGKADEVRPVLRGFHEGNQQHRVNGFDYGLDNLLYAANGDSGGNVRFANSQGKPVSIQGRDFRFHPDGRFEPESGQTQFGRRKNDWGEWFGNNNSNWGWHFVLSDRDLSRNPSTAFTNPRQFLEPNTRVYPISRTLPRFNMPGSANHVTSANSPTPYRDVLFGHAFQNDLFVSEPVHNMIRRVVLEHVGPTYRGRRAGDEADREFLASSDHWFRPTMIKTGPDGALWIADMYRAVIEHPEWIDDALEATLDLREGHDKGRIYRVLPVGVKARPIARLDRLDAKELVAMLDHPNGWTRDAAQRLIVQEHKQDARIPLLRAILGHGTPQGRIHALWSLDGLGELDPNPVLTALGDPDREVRRNAVIVARSLLARIKEARSATVLNGAVLRHADDAESRVRFQVALALGSRTDREAGEALARILRRDHSDPWMRAAVFASAVPHASTILASVFEEGAESLPAEVIESLFGVLAAKPGGRGWDELVERVATPDDAGRFDDEQLAAIAGLCEAAARRQVKLAGLIQVSTRRDAIRDKLANALKYAIALVRDDSASDARRIRAVRIVAGSDLGADARREELAGLFRPRVPTSLQLEALKMLSRTDDRKVAESLLAGWRSHSPAIRDGIVDALLTRQAWTDALLDSLEDGCVPPNEVGAVHRRRLVSSRSTRAAERANAIFSKENEGRSEALKRFAAASTAQGDPIAGALVFRKSCATCHRLEGIGTEVGADLASLADKSPASLFTAILDPNRAFESKFGEFVVRTTDGRVLNGLIASESGAAVTLKGSEGRETSVPRAEIEELAASGRSLMPEGLEKDLSVKDVADLIAFIRRAEPATK